MSATARLGILLLAPGEAQKELAHNEALQTLDVLVSAAVEEARGLHRRRPQRLGPAISSPQVRQARGRQLNLAAYTSGGWRFVAPLEGATAYVRSSSQWATFRSGAWELGALRGSSVLIAGQQVVGAREAAIAGPSGGSVVDLEARSAVGQILTALRHHGLIET